MSTLLLDDVGLCLLRQLTTAWEASESYGETNHLHDYRVTSMNDLHRLGFEYATLVEEFYQHLLFIYANRAYWRDWHTNSILRLTLAWNSIMRVTFQISGISLRSVFGLISITLTTRPQRGRARHAQERRYDR